MSEPRETARQIAEEHGLHPDDPLVEVIASLTADLAQAQQEVDKLNDLIFADDVTNRLLRPPDPLSDAEANALLQTTDGTEWAAMFCRATGFPDVGLALTWFCNAIMAGHDYVVRTTLAAAEQARQEPTATCEKCGAFIKTMVILKYHHGQDGLWCSGSGSKVAQETPAAHCPSCGAQAGEDCLSLSGPVDCPGSTVMAADPGGPTR